MKKEFKVEGIESINPNNYGGMCSRSIAIKASKNIDEGIETIATTDAPVMVMDWDRFSPIREVLPMKYVELPKGDKVPLLDSHSKSSIEKIKGSARNWSTTNNELLAKAYISKSEVSLREKIAEGHIDSVSIGYQTDSAYSVEVPKGAKVSIDGTSYRNEFDDEVPMVVRTWWKPVELSLVPIGADSDAKMKPLREKMESLEKRIKELSEAERNSATGKQLALELENQRKKNLTWHEARLKIAQQL